MARRHSTEDQIRRTVNRTNGGDAAGAMALERDESIRGASAITAGMRSPVSTACSKAGELFAESKDALPYWQWLSQRFALSTGSRSQGMAIVAAAGDASPVGHEYAAAASCANSSEATVTSAVRKRILRYMGGV